MNKLILLLLVLNPNAWASKAKPHATPAKIEAAKSSPSPTPEEKLLVIDGSIYPRDQLPEACNNILKGAKCTATPYGRYHVESVKEDGLVYSKGVFSDPEGPQVIEQSWEKDGHVQKAIVENHALHKISSLEVKGNRVFYQTTDTLDNSIKNSEDGYDSDLVVPSTIMSYIRPFTSELFAGKSISFRIAVLDRRESFTFHMKKVRDEKTIDGEAVMVLEMSPASLIVKTVVAPMYFYVKPGSGEMFAFDGKSGLRRKNGKEYSEMAVKTAYTYLVNQFKLKEAVAAPREDCTDEMIKTGEMKCSVPTTKEIK